MTYKHFYWTIILRLAILVLIAGLTTYLFLQKEILLGIGASLLLVVQAIWIIRYFNKINQWIAFFLLGIENEDTTLKVPPKTDNKAINEVYKGMSRLNELFWQAKKEINTQEHYFKMVINQSATGLFSVNEKGRVINMNPAAEKLIQLTEYQHVNTLSLIDTALPDFLMHSDKNAVGQSAIFENPYGQKLLFKLSDITLEDEKIRLVAVSDITKELDTREVDAWIKLARTLSHEIMNNIAPITTLSQVIAKKFTVEGQKVIKTEEVNSRMLADTVKGLNIIEERSEGLMSFVENYRKFTKLPDPQMKETDLSSLIENNLMAATAFPGFKKIKKQLTIPEKLMVSTDEKLLSQVLTNLLKNAAEAMKSRSIEKPTLSMKVVDSGNRVSIEITNNGPEIPPEIREQIFVPFYTTKKEGSGVGLSLSKQIMLKMGGDIILRTEKTGRTTFAISLPGKTTSGLES